MSKRHAEEAPASSSGQPPIKKIHFEPHLIGPVSTLEEMDIKVLQYQNKKLAQVCWKTITRPTIFVSLINFLYLPENWTETQNRTRIKTENWAVGETTNTRWCYVECCQ